MVRARRAGGGVTAVVGAVGGVGASTTAALLARSHAAEGRRVVLVDLDASHGGIDVLLGLERASGARWPELADARGTLDPRDLDGLLPRWRGVEVLSAGRGPDGVAPASAVGAVWRALLASGAEVVVDVPAHTACADPLAAELLDGAAVLLMTGQDVLGIAGAVAAHPGAVGASTRLLLRRRRAARVAPSEAARALGLPLAGLVPGDRSVAGATERGLGPDVPTWSPLGRAVRRLARSGP